VSAGSVLLDTLHQVETPEGITLALRPAGLPARGQAYVIDLLIRMVVMGTLAALLAALKGFGTGLWLATAFLVEWFYPVLFELMPGAATPGKRIVGLQVLMDSGLPVTAGASVLRNLLRAVDFLPMAYFAGCISMLLRRDFRRLGDLVAGTLVVYAPAALNTQATVAGPALPPARPLTVAQQTAVLHLAERQRRLTPQRLDELAQRLAPWLPLDPHPTQAMSAGERLLALSRWLLGQREAAPASPSTPPTGDMRAGMR